MEISSWVWVATLTLLIVVLIGDLVLVGRRPHEPSLRESTMWVTLYISLAVAFGIGVWFFSGPRYAGEFYAGWLTEYSLSIDNLFVFLIIMSRFSVPRRYQQKVLMVGIVLALILRGAFIAAGAAVIHRFVWVFYIFGIFLVYTAFKLMAHKEEEEYNENAIVKWVRRVVPMTSDYKDGKLHTTVDGKKLFTPLLIVMVAVGTTDLLFALDSIPAIFGLTQEPYLVFTANVFALMGLRQLYFLIGGLLERLVYLSTGLAIVLAFIGVKLVLEAAHENNVPFINGGEPLTWAPEIPIWLSLTVIIGTLGFTTVLSLLKTRNTKKNGDSSSEEEARTSVLSQ